MGKTLGNIDPNKNTQLRSELSQGADVGDYGYAGTGMKYRWTGERWEQEPRSQQDRVTIPYTEEEKAEMARKQVEEARRQYLESVQPAVSSLEQEIPETSAKFQRARTQLEAEKDPLEQRYQNLIAQITGKQEQSENQQTLVTSNEMGRRGISGGLREQQIASAVNPLRTEFGALLKDVGFEKEKSLREIINQISGLTTAETEATRAVRNAIAQTLSGAGVQGVTQGYTNLQNILANNLGERQQSLAEQQYQRENALSDRLLALGYLPNTWQTKEAASGAGKSTSLDDVWNSFGLG